MPSWDITFWGGIAQPLRSNYCPNVHLSGAGNTVGNLKAAKKFLKKLSFPACPNGSLELWSVNLCAFEPLLVEICVGSSICPTYSTGCFCCCCCDPRAINLDEPRCTWIGSPATCIGSGDAWLVPPSRCKRRKFCPLAE